MSLTFETNNEKSAFLTHVILLSAGQGKRLSPLTDMRPKCLVPVAGKTLLEWQLHAIAACGIEDITVVTGFEAQSVEAAVKVSSFAGMVNFIYNPFYSVADNIGSCWAARDILRAGAVLINGDTLFDRRILSRLLKEAEQPVTVTIDRKSHYDDDDMKVKTDSGLLTRIGKKLTGQIDGESIGMLRFQGRGGALFVDEMTAMLRNPDSLKLWYLSIVDRLATSGQVGVMQIDGLPWQEVDFPHDLSVAQERVGQFEWTPAGADDVHKGGNYHESQI